MPTRKIKESDRPYICQSPDHNPPNMMVYEPGVYEHTCSGCGRTTIFTAGQLTMSEYSTALWRYWPERRLNGHWSDGYNI